MHWEAVAVIGALTLLLGALLLVPGLIWARKQARNAPDAQAGMAVTKAGFAFAGAGVLVLFAGFTAEFWIPDTTFGAWLSTSTGRLTYAAATIAVGFGIEQFLRLFGVRIVALKKRHDV